MSTKTNMSIEQTLKDAYLAAEAALQRASDLDEYSSLAEYSLLSTVLYDLSSYFSEDGINDYQTERLIRIGFNPQ
jgi:hypothetical protein